jgi:hypothetical protein
MWNSKIEYELCAENNYAATCVEVLDLGTQKMKSGKTWHPVSLGFELAEQDSAGERFLRRRSLPGRLKSGVTCAFIEGMLDRKLTDDEINGSFDGRQLLGVNDQPGVHGSSIPVQRRDFWSFVADFWFRR